MPLDDGRGRDFWARVPEIHRELTAHQWDVLRRHAEGQAAIGAAGANAVAGEGNRQALETYNQGLEYQLGLLRQIDDHARSAEFSSRQDDV